ncbi:carbon-nitrogen hydrolase family protein [Deinococcus deserti]|uniref:Putative nitrilase n=1 Tax=Deinococcus deserti (strain DSM 17065 / CIP 109153 / LMG 22923 / VCD115) TaxID=546414 RepID=C1D322_DEIDV|nr:carbon-nitrogen hydrolase family protein [Deinococcus deserti]ACO47811.1 putative nitrilase [Deinococcus deserti VCD115]
MKVTVAVVQAEVAPDLDRGLELTAQLSLEAAAKGAQLIAFPETWLPGYPAWLDVARDVALWDHAPVKEAFAQMMENSVAVPGPALDALRDAAHAAQATLVVGVIERVSAGRGQGTLYNTILTINAEGQVLNHHRKLVPTYTERLVWGPGDADGLRVVDTPLGRIGSLVCWEHWMPLARQALHEQAEDIHVATWPTVKDMHQIASRHYAFEGRCFVLAAGSLMRASSLPEGLDLIPELQTNPETLVMRGGSAIIGPDGAYVVEPVYDQPAILVAELDLRRNLQERMTLDVTGHYHRPEYLNLDIRHSGRRTNELDTK